MRDQHRKARLGYLIDTDYKSSRPEFMAAHPWVSKGRLSQALGGKEPFAEDAALIWEEKIGLPAGWFSNTWPTPKESAKHGWPMSEPYPSAQGQSRPTMQQALEVVLDALAALPEKRKSTVLGAMGGYVPESPNARTTMAFLVGEMDGASLGGDLTTPALSPTVERVIRAKLRTETKDITPEGTRTDAGNHD